MIIYFTFDTELIGMILFMLDPPNNNGLKLEYNEHI